MANYRRIARRRARKYGINPRLFARQIGAESGFDPNARSGAGAGGIAQITPGTAAAWGVDPFKPRQALDAAAKHMAGYLHAYHGSWAKALAAYNAGPGAVQQYGGVPPYAETRAYIQRILGGRGDVRDRPGGGAGGQTVRPWQVKIGDQNVFDQAGFETAKKLAIVGQLLAKRHGTGGVLFKTGLLTTEQPDPSEFLSSVLSSKIVKGDPVQLGGGGSGGGGRLRYGPSGGKGGGLVGHPIDRAGVRTSPQVLRAVRRISRILGSPIQLGTGTQHDRMTVNGNVSDHWSGHAIDLPASGKRLYAIGRSALIAAGMSPKKARRAPGGLYNINGWQIIFATTEGGNHWNHVHVHPG